MPDSPDSSAAAPDAPDACILVHNDLILGPHAHTTPAQTAILTSGFDENFVMGILDINAPAAKRLRRDGHDLVIFQVKDPMELLVELDLATSRPKNLRFILASEIARAAAFDDMVRNAIAARKSTSPPSPPPPPSAPAGAPAPAAPILGDPRDPLTPDTAPDFPAAPQLIRLITLGEPEHFFDTNLPPDYYRQRGITPADAPALQRMYLDPEIIYMESIGGGHPANWARHHTLRALVELRAPGTARLMIDELRAARARHAADRDEFGDYSPDVIEPNIEDDIDLLPRLADDACAAIIADLQARGGNDLDISLRLLEMLADIGNRHPHLRNACRDGFCAQLENHPVNDPTYNGFIVAGLIELKAAESAPLIARAYAGGNTAISVCGDWEDVQISLGLATRRATPESIRRDAIRKERGLFSQPLSLRDDEDKSRRHSPPSHAAPPGFKTVGRNDPCPCGSGRKYKKCCMDKNEAAARLAHLPV